MFDRNLSRTQAALDLIVTVMAFVIAFVLALALFYSFNEDIWFSLVLAGFMGYVGAGYVLGLIDCQRQGMIQMPRVPNHAGVVLLFPLVLMGLLVAALVYVVALPYFRGVFLGLFLFAHRLWVAVRPHTKLER